jgi:hypothetical protein
MRREDATCQQKALALTRRLKIKGMRLQRDEVLMHMRRLAEGAVGEIATGRLAAGGPRALGTPNPSSARGNPPPKKE